MRRLESHDWWPQLVALKDERSLRELAEQFSVTPGAITAALRRQGITRKPAPPGPRSARNRKPVTVTVPARRRGASASLESFRDELGTVPDDVIAEKAGVSRRTVASFRKEHGIAGYKGPRRRRARQSAIDAHVHLLGTMPDAEVAELAGVSGNAVRAYRVRRGIPSWRSTGGARQAEPTPTPVPSTSVGHVAWRVEFTDGQSAVVVASSLAAAAGRAELAGSVASITRIGAVLA